MVLRLTTVKFCSLFSTQVVEVELGFVNVCECALCSVMPMTE